MKTKVAQMLVSAVAVLVLGSICIIGVRAQPGVKNSNSSTMTTNWLGYLVAGRSDTFDSITPSPSPTVFRRVEIGLRSDGIVIWREAPKKK